MSFILDALKKSESERQRQSGPALFEVKMAPPRMGGLPWWVIVVAALLLLNFIVVAWVLWRKPPASVEVPIASETTTAPAVAQIAPNVAPPATPTSPTTSRPIGSIPPVPEWRNAPGNAANPAAGTEIGAVGTDAAATEEYNPADYEAAVPADNAAGSASQRTVVTPGSAGAPPSASTRGPTLVRPPAEGGTTRGADATRAAAASNDFPTIDELPPAIANQLPELRLDLHSYSRTAKDRYVFINMRRLNEGDVLPEGVRVEAITPDGAVLSFRNNRFVLERN